MRPDLSGFRWGSGLSARGAPGLLLSIRDSGFRIWGVVRPHLSMSHPPTWTVPAVIHCSP